jgi:ankyrin repeat protein
VHVTVEMCDAGVLESLLACDIDPNVVDGEGRTPLDYAVRNLHYECMVVLLECGADPSKANPKAAETLVSIWCMFTIYTKLKPKI